MTIGQPGISNQDRNLPRKSAKQSSRPAKANRGTKTARTDLKRRLLTQSLEQRQLMAGPELIGIQPNSGQLIQGGTSLENTPIFGTQLLTVSPRELTFRFDDLSPIDARTLGTADSPLGISITRAGADGGFEVASAQADFGTNGGILVEFRAVAPGVSGNGTVLDLVSADRGSGGQSVIITSGTTLVTRDGRLVTVPRVTLNLNSNAIRPTTMRDLVLGIQNSPAAQGVLQAFEIRGDSLTPIGRSIPASGQRLTLSGANSTQAASDLGLGNATRVRFVSTVSGAAGVGLTINVTQRNFNGPAQPIVSVIGKTINVQINSSPNNRTTVAQFITAIQTTPTASELVNVSLERGNASAAITSFSGAINLLGANDTIVPAGYIGIGNSPNEVVFRFAEPLPDDRYQVEIFGIGARALLNERGEAFNDGKDFAVQFAINKAPQVLAVVPEPIRRGPTGAFTMEPRIIEVYFTEDINPVTALNPNLYQLIYTRDTVNPGDDRVIRPISVLPDASRPSMVRLLFQDTLARVPEIDGNGQPILDSQGNQVFVKGTARLKVGNDSALPLTPNQVTVANDAADDFDGATIIGGLSTATRGQTNSVRLTGGQIVNPSLYGLQFPGGSDYEGVRDVRPDDDELFNPQIVVQQGIWREGADNEAGIRTTYYSFVNSSGAGSNIITEPQKQRAREVLSLYSEYLGIQFIELGDLAAAGATIPTDGDVLFLGVGDVRGGVGFENQNFQYSLNVTPGTSSYIDEEGVLQPYLFRSLRLGFDDYDESVDDATTGEVFRAFFAGIGQALGLGFAEHLPQPTNQTQSGLLDPFNPGPPGAINGLRATNEALFPSPSDIVNGQYLYRPESNDIDLYRFTLANSGKLTLSTIAERLSRSSSLDTVLRLYRQAADGSRVEIAANDDYFSNDSLIELHVTAGTYFVGVSASGNDTYDPITAGTGLGGTTQGIYDLLMTFETDASTNITDVTGNVLDGDADGVAGGEFNFWFEPQDADRTIYVDKRGGGDGTGAIGQLQRPYTEIDQAIAVAINRAGTSNPVDTIRIIGGGEYQIGRDVFGNELIDGANLIVPKDVNLIIDAGSTFRMSRSRIGVGSTTASVDRSNSAIQVLGTPLSSVNFVGLNGTKGSWGGIDIRGDIDFANDGKTNLEESAIFLNHIQYADIRDGGGQVSVDGFARPISPIELADVRATVLNNRISNSADGAISATPNTFEETRFDESRFQNEFAIGAASAAFFTSDVMRVGPHIRGNILSNNSVNGLQIRIDAPNGDNALNVIARFDDSDIVHVLTENLLIEGTPGGVSSTLAVPSVVLTSARALAGSTVAPRPIAPAQYVYRVTFVDQNGFESAPSDPTAPLAVATASASILLTNLPVVPDSTYSGRRLYRATVTGIDVDGNLTYSEFRSVGRLNSRSTSFTDSAAAGTNILDPAIIANPLLARAGRLDAGLVVDPGVIVKLDGARIDVTFDAHLYAEGTANEPVIFTSLRDDRYGAGGTFNTSSILQSQARAGDWSGIFVGFGADASFDHAVFAGGGGASTVEGGIASFNVIEAHQSDLRVTNTRFEANADGRTFINDLDSTNNNPDSLLENRVGRSQNASGTIFVRGSQPIITGNTFLGGSGPVMSFDVNSFTWQENADWGRSTGKLEADLIRGNSGPLISRNRIGVSGDNDYLPDAFGQSDENLVGSLNGLEVRGGVVATEVVLDDTDIVHIVRDMIEVPNQHIYGGLRLESDARGSLVVKFQTQDAVPNEVTFLPDVLDRRQAGIVVGGTLITAEDELIDIRDRIGGSLQVVGMPDFPVVLTRLGDDSIGAGFTHDGRANFDTDNNGVRVDENGDPIFIPLANNDGGAPTPAGLPVGPELDRTNLGEINNGATIDNDLDPAVFGYVQTPVLVGSQINAIVATVRNQATQTQLIAQNLAVLWNTFIDVDNRFILDPNPAPIALPQASNGAPITGPTLVSPDRVRSTGVYNVLGRDIRWNVETFIVNNRGIIYTTVNFEMVDGVGFSQGRIADVSVYNYFDQQFAPDDQDRLFQVGTPGGSDFRLVTLNDANRVGFSHGAIYTNDRINQDNATYVGWSADDLQDLFLRLEGLDDQASIAGFAPGFAPIGTETIPGSTLGTFASGPAGVPGDIATAHAWRLNGNSVGARITSFVEVVASDPANPFTASLPAPVEGAGDWDGITIREAASDRNVQITGENEPANVIGGSLRNDTNAIPAQAQYLGELAPTAQAADESRRVGLIVDGEISRPGDIDVYSFIAEAGTQVWLDIDRTNSRLDTVIELIDSNGQTLILSDDSISEAGLIERFLSIDPTSPDAVLQRANLRAQIQQRAGAASTFDIDQLLGLGTRIQDPNGPSRAFQDQYTTNAKDAGMRIVLPGEAGQRLLYQIRVRSSSLQRSSNGQSSGLILTNPDSLGRGLTSGAYQMQIRLTEADVFAGTQIRYSDVRFATNGVQIIGGPISGPLVGDDYDNDTTTRNNNTLANAQRLGLFDTQYVTARLAAQNARPAGAPVQSGDVIVNADGSITIVRNLTINGVNNGLENITLSNDGGPLSSDRLAKNISGTLANLSDVDWYEFEIDYKQISPDDSAQFLSTIIDLDYASGLDRGTMALYLFDSTGALIELNRVGGNVADDLASNSQSPNNNLGAGSFTSADPFIGARELREGTYFLAVAYRGNEPTILDQFTNPATTNPLLRLAPAESVRRVVEERFTLDPLLNPYPGTFAQPEFPLLFDDASIRDFSLDDVMLYVNTASSLLMVNPFTGATYGTIGGFGDEILDVAFTANGELFGYTGFGTRGPGDDNFSYRRINTANATLSAPLSIGGDIQTFHNQATEAVGAPQILDVASDDGIEVEAITIRSRFVPSVGSTNEVGYLVGNRPINRDGLEYFQNILYQFTVRDDATTALNPGDIIGPAFNRDLFDAGAGTTPREIGVIDTTVTTTLNNRLGLVDATVVNGAGVGVPALFDGDTFVISNGVQQVTFELNQGLTVIAGSVANITDGQRITIALPPAVSPTPLIFEFDSNAVSTIDTTIPSNGVITFDATLTGTQLIQRLADAIRARVIAPPGDNPANLLTPVFNDGIQLSVPGALSITQTAGSAGLGTGLVIDGTAASPPENRLIVLRPTDTAADIALRIQQAITTAQLDGSLPNVTASIEGNSIRLSGIVVGQPTRSIPTGLPIGAFGPRGLIASGLANGGLIKGIEILNGNVYAVSDTGGLYVVPAAALNTNVTANVATFVETATDLAGLEFTGLRAGPNSVQGGLYNNLLFGTTANGNIYAFNTLGVLQPIFSGGRTFISTGIQGLQGLDFSTLDYNLWHIGTNGAASGQPGHGYVPLENNSHAAQGGTSSLIFNYNSGVFGNRYTFGEDPVQTNAAGVITNPRQDGQIIQDTYNFPGGAKGTVQSNTFSLEKHSAADAPVLYFNYFLETDPAENTDVLNAYIIDERGVEHLAATNNVPLANLVPNPNPASATSITPLDIQPLFDQPSDNTDPTVVQNWRQARVDLSPFAGQRNLSLRFEFSTAGTTLTNTTELRLPAADLLADGARLVVNGQTFLIDLNPAIQFPSGAELAQRYAGNTVGATFTIDGTTYVLTDGTRTIATGQIGINVLIGQPTGTTLNQLSAAQIATAVRRGLDAAIPLSDLVPSGATLANLYQDPAARFELFLNGQTYLLDDGFRVVGIDEDVVVINVVTQFNALNPNDPPKTLVDLTEDDIASVVGSVAGETDQSVEAAQLVPTNLQLARLYQDTAARFAVTIDGVTYVLNDGTRTVAVGEVSVPVSPISTTNLPLALATAIATQTGRNIPVSNTFTGVNFSDLSDPVDPFGNPNPASSRRNDFFQDATPLPFEGVDTLIVGAGSIGVTGSALSSDVDFVSIELAAGSQLIIDTDLQNIDGTIVIRVFGPDGVELPESIAAIGSATGQLRVTVPRTGRYVIGFSATGNDQYTNFGGRQNGNFVGVFDANVQIIVPPVVDDTSALLELGNDQVVTFAPGFGISVLRNAPPTGAIAPVFIPVRHDASPVQVAAAVREALANTFFGGNEVLIPQVGSMLRMDRLTINNPGTFEVQTGRIDGRVGDRFGSSFVAGAAANEFEGAYIDDIIIGFAERGEGVTGARVLAPDELFSTVPTVTPPGNFPIGSYNIEIRDASEYISRTRFNLDGTLKTGVTEGRFRTFGTNERLSDGLTLETLPASAIADGVSFTIADSDTRITFEFDVLDSSGVSNGFVNDENRIVIRLNATDSDAVVADKIIRLINSAPIQSILNVRAGRANGTAVGTTTTTVSGIADCFINLYGNVSVRVDTSGRRAFANVIQSDLRGDVNRDFGSQGVLMIENNRFLLSSDAGVDINRDSSARVLGRDIGDATPNIQRYVRNLIELNTENLIPGVSVRNNVVAFNADSGIRIAGLLNGGLAQENPVGFDRIVNNTIIGGTIERGVDLGPQVFGSILFDRGAISFADSVVVETLRLGADVAPQFSDPDNALGAPDADGQTHELCTVSLGSGGRATFRFEDNLLVGDGTSAPDLVIYETGNPERVGVEISRDGVTFVSVGQIFGRSNTIDLDAFGFGPNDQFAFVRLTDLSPAGTFNFGEAGADIDAVGAISTVPREAYTPGSQGIFVHQNSAPTLLNNIVANLQTGIAVVPPNNTIDVSRDLTVIAGTTYFRNSVNARNNTPQAIGAFPQFISDFEQIFVDPTRLVFTPQSGSMTIDSAVSSLLERGSLATVKSAVGIPPSPIVTPRLDLNGQLRIDDPTVETPRGFGFNSFVDRGAEDRRDQEGPRAVLVAPRGDELFIEAGRAFSRGTIFDAFEIQLVDGIAPADPAPGVGVFDASVRSQLVRVTRLIEGSNRVEVLEEGVDYRFAYEPGDNTIRLTPIAGIWTDNTVYKVELLGNVLSENASSVVSILRAQEGRFYGDGALTFIGDRVTLETESGILLSILADELQRLDPLTGLNVSNIDGQTVTVFDGVRERTFEFDTEPVASSDPLNIAIRLPASATTERITELLAAAINASDLQLIAIHLRSPGNTGRLQLLGTSAASSAAYVTLPDTSFARQVNRTLDVTLAINVTTDVQGNIQTNFDGALITIFDGTQEVTFEFDSDNNVVGGDVVIPIRPDTTPREISNLLIDAIRQQGLNVNASAASGTFRISGTTDPISVTSETGSALVIGNSAVGVSPGYGIVIPTLNGGVSPFVQEGQTFSVTRLGADPIRFELDSDGQILTPGAISIPLGAAVGVGNAVPPTALANAIATAISNNVPGLTATNIGNGFIRLSDNVLYALNMGGTALYQTGFLNRNPSTAVVIPIDGVRDTTRQQLTTKFGPTNPVVASLSRTETGDRLIAALYSEALIAAGVPNEQPDNRVLIRGIANVEGQAVINDRIQDEVGNRLLAGEVTIFIGGTFDFGDVAGFGNTVAQNGARHQITDDPSLGQGVLYLGQGVTADADGVSDNSDRLDDGIRPLGNLRPGFTTNFEIGINLSGSAVPNASSGQPIYLDSWFDWNRNGIFESSELQRFNSLGTGIVVDIGLNPSVPVRVPANALLGETAARFRVSYDASLATDPVRGAVGVAMSGEVEDYTFTVSNNPFQSTRNRWDVNNSGDVSPLDALLIINLLNLVGGNVNLANPPAGVDFTNFFPDVSGDGQVTAMDALQVINRLNESSTLNPEPITTYVPVANGVLASGATVAFAPTNRSSISGEPVSQSASPASATVPSKVVDSGSVFDSPAVMGIDDIVDTLASDRPTESDEATSAVDEVFASLF